MVEDDLAHTHGLGSDFDKLVLLDVFEALFQRHDGLGDDAGFLVGTRGADIGELLGLADVDHEVVVVDMLANHLSGIDVFTWIDEEFTTILQLVDGIGEGIARIHGDHGAVDTTLYLTLVGLVFLKAVGHDGLALRGGEHVGAQTNDTTRGDVELDVDTLALVFHRGHLTFTTGDHINHLGGKLLGHVDGELFDRLALLTIDLFIDDLRLTYLQLVALATHGLDEYGEVEHATT